MAEETCKYCGKVWKNKNSCTVHGHYCEDNPNRIDSPFAIYQKELREGKRKKTYTNQYDKAQKLGLDKPTISDKTRQKMGDVWRGRRHSEESKKKISTSMKKYLTENPDKVPYLLNHYSHGPSYPEIYWMDLIAKEKLDLSYHKQIWLYQLDFFNGEKKIDLEIDGKQHENDPRIKESDLRRTQYLENLGWKVIRVKWDEWKSSSKKKKKVFVETLRKLLGC